MPRLSEARPGERRRHILTSAWSCFSRNGFHATSMDDVIAATGMSSSAVSRYFRSRDDLIDAVAAEARDRGEGQPYDLSRIVIQACGGALRSPELERRTQSFYLSMRDTLYRASRSFVVVASL